MYPVRHSIVFQISISFCNAIKSKVKMKSPSRTISSSKEQSTDSFITICTCDYVRLHGLLDGETARRISNENMLKSLFWCHLFLRRTKLFCGIRRWCRASKRTSTYYLTSTCTPPISYILIIIVVCFFFRSGPIWLLLSNFASTFSWSC